MLNVVQLGAGISTGDVTLTRSGENLVIAINGTSDTLTINNQHNVTSGIEQLRFADGTVWNRADIVSRTTYQLGAGNDTVTGWSEAGNVIYGNGGNDSITGHQYNDFIDGGDGRDTLNGGSGADILIGGAGDDTVDGVRGNDTLSGGTGNDSLGGYDGSDTYLFGRGDGQDTITETHGMYSDITGDADVVQLGAGIATADVTLTRSGEKLVIAINGTSDTLTVTNQSSNYSGIEQLRFADGTVWDRADIASRTTYLGGAGNDTVSGWSEAGNVMYGNAGNDSISGNQYNDYIDGGDGHDTLNGSNGADTLVGGAGNDNLSASSGADRLQGDAGDDTLSGGIGNDTLSGGTGNDSLDGCDGSDTYLFGRGDGQDTIAETHGMYSDVSGDVDVVQLEAGIATEDLTLTRLGASLVIAINGTSDTLTVTNQSSSYGGIEQLCFADGTVWDRADIAGRTTYLGSAGNDTVSGWSEAGNVMYGNAGNDSISGNQYNDYIDGGDGHDTLNGSNGADTLVGGAGNDKLTASSGADLLQGDAGDDTLDGGIGNDTLSGGAGNDALGGYDGSDTYRFDRGDGQDTITETHGMYSDVSNDVDVIQLGEGIATADVTLTRVGESLVIGIAGTSDSLIVTNQSSSYSGIEQLRFADGTVWDRADIAGRTTYLGSAGNDTVNGWSEAGNVMYGNGGNDSITGGAFADLLNGGLGNDILKSSAGIDILQGGDGDDSLSDTSGKALFDGGTGTDTLTGGASAELYLGGTGNDTLTTGAGNDLILFNQGDGQDTFAAGGTGSDMLSLGGAFAYSDLSFTKSSNDLVLKLGATDQITFKNWYAATPSKPVVNLQVIAEAMADFDAGGGNPLLDQKIENFNFAGLVGAFDAARNANPTLTAWALSNALTSFQLAGSDTAALGGDLAYQYGKNGTLAGMGLSAAQGVLGDPTFGSGAQTLQPLASLQTGSVRLS
ncbi:MAG: calcium-binding protein [Propionivibrio sp.]